MKFRVWHFLIAFVIVFCAAIACQKNPTINAYLSVHKESCIGCGACERVCKASAITFISNKAVIDPSKCTHCGMCQKVCPQSAIF